MSNQATTSVNFFGGSEGLKTYLDPSAGPLLPLVELPASLNPFLGKGVHIYVKIMTSLPLMNVKSIPALRLLQESKPGTTSLVEASSGNTVMSLGLLAKQYGIERVRAMVSREVSNAKLKMLQLSGVEVEVNDEPICPDPSKKDGAIYNAKKYADEHAGWENLGQYHNKHNPSSHYDLTGPQIWMQLNGKIDVLCAGLGTTGTVVGTGRYLKDQKDTIKVVGVAREPNNNVPGVRTKNLLFETKFGWESIVDEVLAVGSRDSYERSLELIRSGLLLGPSTGFAYAGLLEYLQKTYANDQQRTPEDGVHAVFIAPDTPFPYIDDYFTYLDPSFFPAIENVDLLFEKDGTDSRVAGVASEITIEELLAELPQLQIAAEPKGSTKDLIDVREPREFADHSVYGSINVPLNELRGFLQEHNQTNEFIFICSTGVRSYKAAQLAQSLGYSGRSLKGGTSEWSERGLPRRHDAACIANVPIGSENQ